MAFLNTEVLGYWSEEQDKSSDIEISIKGSPYENEKWAAHWRSGQLSGQELPTIYVNSL